MGKVSGITVVALLLLAAAGQLIARAETKAEMPATSVAAIRTELDRQVAAWNRGDLKEYMGGYWHSPELTFFAGSKESDGWEAAYHRYQAAYLSKDKEMGRLTFTKIRVEVLGPEAAFVRGAWQLTMKDGSTRGGLFTVVLRKFDDGWRIIHDHSS